MTCYDEEWTPVSCVNFDEECPTPLHKKSEGPAHAGSLAHSVSVNIAASFHAIMQQTKQSSADKKTVSTNSNDYQKTAFHRSMQAAIKAIPKNGESLKKETYEKMKMVTQSALEMKERQLLAKKREGAFLRAMNHSTLMNSGVNGLKQHKENEFLHALKNFKRALLKKNTSARNVERMLQEKKASFYRASIKDIF